MIASVIKSDMSTVCIVFLGYVLLTLSPFRFSFLPSKIMGLRKDKMWIFIFSNTYHIEPMLNKASILFEWPGNKT